MGQAEVSKALKKYYPEFITLETIQSETHTTRGSIFRCLRVLSKFGDIQVKTEWLEGQAKRQKTYYRLRVEEENGKRS